MINKSVTFLSGEDSEWSYQLQNDFKVTSMTCHQFYYFLDFWFKKIKYSLISITEKEQVNIERSTGRRETMYVANGHHSFY